MWVGTDLFNSNGIIGNAPVSPGSEYLCLFYCTELFPVLFKGSGIHLLTVSSAVPSAAQVLTSSFDGERVCPLSARRKYATFGNSTVKHIHLLVIFLRRGSSRTFPTATALHQSACDFTPVIGPHSTAPFRLVTGFRCFDSRNGVTGGARPGTYYCSNS